MDTTLTVGSIRSIYGNLASTKASFVSELNEVTAKLLNSDIWRGCSHEVLFPMTDEGYIVLPPQYASVLGYTFNDIPLSVFGEIHQYIEMGMGWRDVTEMGPGALIPTKNVVAQKEISAAATLRVKLSLGVDAGKTIRFFGLDQNSQAIYSQPSGIEGITLTTVNPSADTTQQFTVLDGIQVSPAMQGRWTLWQVVSGVETLIGTYDPGNSVPSFRRYKIGLRTDQDTVRCFCRRQWIPVVAETDWVFPGCLPALKRGFKALQLEDANKQDDADAEWGRSEAELDRELALIRGSEIPSIKMFGGPYPRFNFFVN